MDGLFLRSYSEFLARWAQLWTFSSLLAYERAFCRTDNCHLLLNQFTCKLILNHCCRVCVWWLDRANTAAADRGRDLQVHHHYPELQRRHFDTNPSEQQLRKGASFQVLFRAVAKLPCPNHRCLPLSRRPRIAFGAGRPSRCSHLLHACLFACIYVFS